MASSSASCSLASLASESHPWRYDVFLNFRGVDTRRSFISHLYDALGQKDLQTFFDDNELERGEEIAQSLLQAIQDSNVAIVIFSKDYASSTWCLDELAKIIECHQIRGQIVIPIFYEVDPSHIRKQSHDVATAFKRHEQNPKKAHRIQKWRDALTIAANLCGLDSRGFRNDLMLINQIVEDISKKLKKSIVSNHEEELVGMNSHVEQIKNALAIQAMEVYIIGIWGMGGIGKTTIVEFFFKMMSSEFDGSCFLRKVGEESRARDLQKELISQLLCQKNPNVYAFPKARFQYKKILIILDDVDDPQQIDSLIGDPCWFGSKSVIIITSRDKQVFERRANFLYKVKPLDDYDALKLFNRSAFKQNYPRNDYASLSNSIIKYAQGNPLALKVLGSSLIGKNIKEWQSALNKLSKVPNLKIQHVLQVSYDGLDRMQKDMFLHIACFFKGENKDVVMKVLENCEFDVDIITSVLVDKCLVTIFENKLEVHDLLQDMGKEIVRQESKYPHERSRLWDPIDIYEVFAENKGAEAVESIILDMSKIEEINLNPKVFKKMPNLKFLKFYVPKRHVYFEEQSRLHIPQGLDYLPNKLRYFHWYGYPSESFPLSFQPKNLIVLELRYSKIKQFQKKTQDFGNLLKAPSCLYRSKLDKVTSLSFAWCKNISHLPNSTIGLLEALEILNLNHCKNLIKFPKVSSNIKRLDLSSTGIKQVPLSAIEHLGKLEELKMFDCKKLESLPSNFFHMLTSLTKLHLSGSCRLKNLPEILEDNNRLEEVSVDVMELPSSICNLKRLKRLYIFGNKQDFGPERVRPEIPDLAVAHQRPPVDHHSLLGLSGRISSLQKLCFSMLTLRDLPEDLSFLSFLRELNLSKNDFERIPASIKQLSKLYYLNIGFCRKLLFLPELPLSLCSLTARNCTSIEQMRDLKKLVFEQMWEPNVKISLYNCLKLDEDECHAAANVLLRNHLTALARYQNHNSRDSFFLVYPGSRIPEWVKYQSTGDSIEVALPLHWLNHFFLGFAFYVCIGTANGNYDPKRIIDSSYNFYVGDGCSFNELLCNYFTVSKALKEHMMVVYKKKFRRWVNSIEDVALFKFSVDSSPRCPHWKILKCGVIPVYAQDQDGLCHTLEFPAPVSTVTIEEVDSD